MQTIILASPQVDQWQAFCDALQIETQAEIVKVRSGVRALEAAQKLNPLAVVVDETLGDCSGIELVQRLLSLNAMIHTAMASNHPEAIFHETTEGLGILMQLPPLPTPAEAGRFAACLRQVAGAI
jgi:DNA-binding NtrC family response regulator